MSEGATADGLYLRCRGCTRLALLPYTDQTREYVSTQGVRDWALRHGRVYCDRCVYELDQPWDVHVITELENMSPTGIKGEAVTPEMEHIVTTRYGKEFESKALGIMLSSGRRPVKVVCDDELDQVMLYDDDRLLLSLDRVAFDELTVHDILTRAGVTIHE